jgi:hypothetical protein
VGGLPQRQSLLQLKGAGLCQPHRAAAAIRFGRDDFHQPRADKLIHIPRHCRLIQSGSLRQRAKGVVCC